MLITIINLAICLIIVTAYFAFTNRPKLTNHSSVPSPRYDHLRNCVQNLCGTIPHSIFYKRRPVTGKHPQHEMPHSLVPNPCGTTVIAKFKPYLKRYHCKTRQLPAIFLKQVVLNMKNMNKRYRIPNEK